MRQFRRWIIDECTRLLTQPLATYVQRVPNNFDTLKRTLRKGDVLLVEGDQRISQVIRYLTQSSWSHCAIYVGDELLLRDPGRAEALRARFGDAAQHLLVEADSNEGVTASALAKYERYNIRVCRPQGLRREDVDVVLGHVIDHLGVRYNVRHIFELARFFFPVSLVPRRWRRAALTFGSSPSGRAAICSTMIAEAFTRVGYPILPEVVLVDGAAPGPWWRRWLGNRDAPQARFRRANTALITPRDFDLSPYFEVVKFNHLGDPRFDYKRIVWDDTPQAEAVAAAPAARAAGPQRRLPRLRPAFFSRSDAR
ncbi:MAG: YiiX/YebB-like N1pC/P60 family cysteine hydrolase [Candidatus Binatia bacterium]